MIPDLSRELFLTANDPIDASRQACARMEASLTEAIRERGVATLALSGGSSPLAAYKLLAGEAIDWTKVHVFWVDERAVSPTHERSNYARAKEVLLDPAGVPPTNVHRMQGEASDLRAAAAAYEAELRATVRTTSRDLPSLDLQILGIGTDGHTASLFPRDPALQIVDRLVADVHGNAEREARLTLTVPLLENAKMSVVIVLGADKRLALQRITATEGHITDTPGRILRGFRGSVCWIVDRAADVRSGWDKGGRPK